MRRVAGSAYPDYLQVSTRPYAPMPGAYRAGIEVELLPGFETSTGTDELIVEIQPGNGVLTNDYPGGEGSYESYGYYRYGFNGKENDNEVKGAGNQQDYGMRIYDPRLGRFLSVDPLTKSYPFYSPYQFAGNGPIKNIDLDGAEPAGNYWDWEIVGHGHVHTITVITKTGDAISARAEQIKVKDKNGWTGWITKATYETVYQGITQKSASYAWYNDSKELQLPAKDQARWMPFETEIQRRSRQITELADNTSTAIFGGALLGAAAPAVSALGSTYLGGKFVSTGIDFSAQMLVNGGNLNDINLTSLATSFVFNNSSSLKNLLLKNSIANGLQLNSGSGYRGFLGDNVNNANVFYNIAVGTLLDKITVGLQNLNSDITPAQLGRWQNLSYKPKFNLMLQQYQRNQNTSDFLNSIPGQVVTGMAGNAVSSDSQNENH